MQTPNNAIPKATVWFFYAAVLLLLPTCCRGGACGDGGPTVPPTGPYTGLSPVIALPPKEVPMPGTDPLEPGPVPTGK